jgi:hypothetical protein
MIVFILEDNNDKRNQIIEKYGHGTIVSTNSVIRAKNLIGMFPDKFILYLDGELPDGRGEEFLKWMIENHFGQIQEVVITSFGLSTKLIMKRMCETNGVQCSSYA